MVQRVDFMVKHYRHKGIDANTEATYSNTVWWH